MFESLHDYWKRRKVQKKFESHFEEAREEAQRIGNSHRLDRVIAEANFAFELLHCDIQKRETNRLVDEAARLDIETPPYDDWQDTPSGKILPLKARSELRRSIDEERVRRRDVKVWWFKNIILPAFTLGIGIIGAITGLVAVLKK